MLRDLQSRAEQQITNVRQGGPGSPRDPRTGSKRMERETGIEPATSSLGSWHSTAELLPLENSASINVPLHGSLLQAGQK